MMKKKIKIELLSDMCVSDGSIYNSSIDVDICHDSYGLPYIPAKRIKGCLRECALELKEWGYDIEIDKMFGKEGNERGKIIIYNAYLPDRDKIIDEISKANGNILCHPQNILKNYSYIRTQTAIDYDTGVADEKSLRTMRVINKNLVFEADVKFAETDDIEKLEDCLAIFKHIGISRTRGYGEIKAELVDYSEVKNDCKNSIYENDSIGLEYEIKLNTPIICKSVAGQEESSVDYIEGSKILGYIAQMVKNDKIDFISWLSDSDIKCSNAYITDGDKRFYEVPASMFEIKNDKTNLRNKIYIKNTEFDDEVPLCDKGLQLNQMKHCYVYINDDGDIEKKSVEMETRYHHKRPEDKSVGRADSEADPNSVFYQISSIKEGQKFRGFITGKEDHIKKIYEHICKDQNIMLGYGRNGEYGSCTIRVTGLIKKSKSEEKEMNRFYVLLKSPAIVYNENAMYSTDAQDLKEEILAAVIGEDHVDKDIRLIKYINISAAGGYNVTWGHRKPTVSTFDKGTVLIFETKNNDKLKVKTGQLWIGERNTEGFGEIEVKEFSDNGSYCCEYLKQVKNESEDSKIDIADSDLLRNIADKLFKDFIRYNSSIFVSEKLKVDSSWKATISNMMIMVKESSNIYEVEQARANRYDDKSGKKNEKGKKARKILDIVSGKNGAETIEDLAEKFAEYYNILNYDYDKNDLEMYYLRELLIQIKYAVRQKESILKDEEA